MSVIDEVHWGGRDRIANLEANVAALQNGGSMPALTVTPVTHGTYGLTLKDDSANTVYKVGNGGADSSTLASSVILYGTNGTGLSGEAWNFGVDVAAPTPYRDFFLSKVLSNGNVSDADGMYISAGADDATPASVGFGLAQPPEGYRVHVQPSSLDLTQGGLIVNANASQTGSPFVVLAGNSEGTSDAALRVDADFGTRLKANPANRVVTDGVTNSTTTVTSATANFTAKDKGRFITGTGIPSGSYISSVTNSTTVVISQAATASASGVTLTIVVPHFSARMWSEAPLIHAHLGSGAGAVSIPVLTGIGPGATATPTATLDVAQIGSTAATFKVRNTGTGNGVLIQADGSGATAKLWTTAATSLAIGTNSTAVINIGSAGQLGFYNATAVAKQTVSGSKGANAALASLLTALATLGLVTDSTT